MKRLLLIGSFLTAFAANAAFAQSDAEVNPEAPVIRTEEQMVKETVCPAMRKDETYAAKNMVSYKKIAAGDDGWVFRTSTDYRTDFSFLPKTIDYLQQMQAAFKAQGIEFVYMLAPTRGIAAGMHATGDDPESVAFFKSRAKAEAGYNQMIAKMKAAGLNVVGFPDLDYTKPYFYKRDHHWNPDGAKMAAERIAQLVKALPVYASIPKMAFTTTDKGEYDYAGPFGDALQPICKLYLMAEKARKYETVQASNGTADAMFSEAKPEVVLLGTSNSAADPSVANFEGFLKEALGTDVYNASFVGAGIDTPLLSYLNSAEFKQHKPKVVIWEVPGYYDLNVWYSRIYRQAIPATIGDCEGNAVAEAKAINITQPNFTALQGLSAKKIAGSNYYLTFSFSKAVKKNMNFALKFKDREDKYKISRVIRNDDDKHFYLMLKDWNAGNLESVTMDLPKEAIGVTMDIRICKMPAGQESKKVTKK